MSLILIIVFSIISVILMVVLLVLLSAKKTEKLKYYTAAGNTLREEYLNYSLRNNLYGADDLKHSNFKQMIYLKTKYGKQKIKYVFNPENRIIIGRDKYESNIYVNNKTVSKKHCCIYLENGYVYLEDMNASNGTIVERGMFQKYRLISNNRIALNSKDKIVIGSSVIKVILFNYDMSAM